jgi:hypothetical protein
VATALQLYASQLRKTARSLAERLTASILAPLIRVASPQRVNSHALDQVKGHAAISPLVMGARKSV